MNVDGSSYGLVTANADDRPFGYPDVDAVIVDYRNRLRAVLVA